MAFRDVWTGWSFPPERRRIGTLVLGDPIVALGDAGADPRRRAHRRGLHDRRAPGARADLEARGPFDRVLGSPRALRDARVRQRPLPLASSRSAPACTSSSSSARTCSSRRRPATIDEEDLYTGDAVGTGQRDQGRADRDGRHVLRAPRDGRLRCGAGAPRVRGRRAAHRVRAREPRPEPLRARARRTVPRAAAGRSFAEEIRRVADGLRLAGGRRHGDVRTAVRRLARPRRPHPYRDGARLDAGLLRRAVPAVPPGRRRPRHGPHHPRAGDARRDDVQPRDATASPRCAGSPTSACSRRRRCWSTSCG